MALVKEETFYNDLDAILEDINKKCIRITPEYKKICVRTAHLVAAVIVKEMRETDEVFDKLFSRIDYVGSYYGGLKVKEPTSFNMNLIMKLPMTYKYVEVQEDLYVPGFVKLNCQSAVSQSRLTNANVKRVFNSWIDEDGFLLETKPRYWLEGVLARAMNNLPSGVYVLDEYMHIQMFKNGPSLTVQVSHGGTDMDIIFAFTIEFPSDILPPSSFRRHNQYAYPWIVVSDTLKKDYYGRTDELWRISFPGLERRLLHNQYKLKYVLRFLKAFRDAQTNVVIPSYFITNLFLWEMLAITEGEKPPRFWEKRTGFLFIHMMAKLHEVFKEETLYYYWSENINLLRNYNRDHLFNMKGQLNNIITKINNLISIKHYDGLRSYMFKLYSY